MLDAEVKELLMALKAGIEATACGVIDGGRGWLHASSEHSPGAFWAAFTELDCLRGEWGDWDKELLASGAAGVMCHCGAHRVQTRMIHTRWIIVALSEGDLLPGAEKVVEHAAAALARLLPASPPAQTEEPPIGEGSGGGGGQGPAELGIPIGWIRKRTPS